MTTTAEATRIAKAKSNVPPSVVRRPFHAAHELFHLMLLVGWWLRRLRMISGLRIKCAWHRAPLDCGVDAGVRVGRGVRFVVEPKKKSTVRMGAGCVLGDDVRIELRGGSLLFGEQVDIRPRCTLNVSGRLEMHGGNLIQTGVTVHCDEAVSLGRGTTLAEYATLVDSSHTFEGPHAWFVHNVVTSPISIGDDAWLGAKVTVGRGVHIGARAVISANSLVVKDVPAGFLASGVPAQVLRPVPGSAKETDGVRQSNSS